MKSKLKLKSTEGTRNGLTWGAFLLAALGGITATACWVSAPVIFVVGIFWWWMPFVLTVGVGLLVVGDVLIDGIPNRSAIYGAIVWPSFVASVQGRLGETFRGWIADLNTFLDDTIGVWVTDAPRGSAALMTVISMAAITFAVMFSHRYGAKLAAAERRAELERRAAAEQRAELAAEQRAALPGRKP